MTVSFHTLVAETETSRGRAVAEFITGLVLYALFMGLFILAAVLIAWPNPDFSFSDINHPLPFTLMMMSLVASIPAVFTAAWVVGKRSPGTLISVAGRVRWQPMVVAAAITLPVYAVALGLQILFAGHGPTPLANWPIMLIMVVLLVPLQGFAEELVFRAWLPQLLGTFRAPAIIAYGLPLLVFTYGHIYDWKGLAYIFFWGAVVSWMTHVTRGVEMATGFHVASNLTIFVVSVLVLGDLNDSEVLLTVVLMNMLADALIIFLCWQWWRSRGTMVSAASQNMPDNVSERE